MNAGGERIKRPLSAFMLFSQAQRGEIKKKHPDYKVSDVAKELGRMWGTMSAGQKEKYQKEGAVLKEKYDRETGKTK